MKIRNRSGLQQYFCAGQHITTTAIRVEGGTCVSDITVHSSTQYTCIIKYICTL